MDQINFHHFQTFHQLVMTVSNLKFSKKKFNFTFLGVTVPTLLEKINYMITDCNQNESILELASKLAIYAAENARKRQRETKDEIGKTFS